MGRRLSACKTLWVVLCSSLGSVWEEYRRREDDDPNVGPNGSVEEDEVAMYHVVGF